MNSKERCMASIRGETVDRVPVFPLLMFFAQSRLGITYRDYATSGRALAESQLNIQEKYGVDAITACSDAFRITADLGAKMVFPDDKPPYASEALVTSPVDLDRLKYVDPHKPGSRMADRTSAVKIMADCATESLVLGWVDMPFAEACSLCGVTGFMLMMVTEPGLAHSVLRFVTRIVIDFSLAQLDAGAPMIGAGDAAASLISPEQYREFALPYEQEVVNAVHSAGGLVKLHICGDTTHLINDMVSSGADLFNVDHLVDFSNACKIYGDSHLCFKGNLNPVSHLMQSTPEECTERCFNLLEQAGGRRYMLSAGCEIPADTPDDVFEAFCRAPLEFSSKSQKK